MNGLFNQYGLAMDDIFRHQHFVIIKRAGIEKIMARAEIMTAVRALMDSGEFSPARAGEELVD